MRLAFTMLHSNVWGASAGLFNFFIGYDNILGYSVSVEHTALRKRIWLAGGGLVSEKPRVKTRNEAEALCYEFLKRAFNTP